MAEHSAQERTEAPTARKLRKARDEGQVARSGEVPTAAVVIGGMLCLLMAGGWFAYMTSQLLASGLQFDRKTLVQPLLLPAAFGAQLLSGLWLVAPIMVVTAVVALLVTSVNGGYLFSLKAVQLKFDKLNPLEGFKRMFGPTAFVELGKALLKFLLVVGVLAWSIAAEFDALMKLGRMDLQPALALAGRVILQSSLWVALSLALVAAIDLPYQRHRFMSRMRMTKQEVKDEMKEVEGRPEVKQAIRRKQIELSQARMMQRIQDADVVITNPEHFAVALEYDPDSDRPPVLVAKGADLVAARIREQAALHGVHVFSAPPLARALYFSTELERPIPEALYLGVAQVIAYVYSLEGARPGVAPALVPVPEVPSSMLFDAQGRRLADEAQSAS